jgi:hypothetical protein
MKIALRTRKTSGWQIGELLKRLGKSVCRSFQARHYKNKVESHCGARLKTLDLSLPDMLHRTATGAYVNSKKTSPHRFAGRRRAFASLFAFIFVSVWQSTSHRAWFSASDATCKTLLYICKSRLLFYIYWLWLSLRSFFHSDRRGFRLLTVILGVTDPTFPFYVIQPEPAFDFLRINSSFYCPLKLYFQLVKTVVWGFL